MNSRLSLRCIRAAKEGMFFEDFKIQARISLTHGEDYPDQIRTLLGLIDEGFVRLSNSRLALGELTRTSWIQEGIESGLADVWDIIDNYPKQAWKFNPEDLSRALLGSKGEEFVVDLLKDALAYPLNTQIEHLSLLDDSLGFDIRTPSTKDNARESQIEVKTTSRPGQEFGFFLTRNEYASSLRCSNWNLVLVQIVAGSKFLLGHVPARYLEELVPINVSESMHWELAHGRLDTRDVLEGLP